MHVVTSKMSAADTVSEPETDTEQKGADGSKGRNDGRFEDEKKMRTDSPVMSDYMLKCSQRTGEKELMAES